MYYVRSYTSACCDLFYRNRQSRNCLARPSHNSSKYAQGLGQGTHVYFKDFFVAPFYRIGGITVFRWGLVQSSQLGWRRSAKGPQCNQLIISKNWNSQVMLYTSYLLPFSLGPEKRQRYVDMAKEYNEKASSLLWTTVPKLNMKYSKIFYCTCFFQLRILPCLGHSCP